MLPLFGYVITLPHWTEKLCRARKTAVEIKPTRRIHRLCALGATAGPARNGYGAAQQRFNRGYLQCLIMW
jgi:hypothetical protein